MITEDRAYVAGELVLLAEMPGAEVFSISLHVAALHALILSQYNTVRITPPSQ